MIIDWLYNSGKLESTLKKHAESYNTFANPNDVTSEVVANAAEALLRSDKFVEEMFTDSDFAEMACNENKSLAHKFVALLKNIIEGFKKGLKRYALNHSIAEDFASDVNRLEKAVEIWTKAFNKQEGTADVKVETADTTENTADMGGEGEVKYSRAEDNEDDHVKDQIRNNLHKINNTESVADIIVDTNLSNKKLVKKWIFETLKNTGFSVDRQNFGVIDFSERMINTALNYAESAGEYAAFATLPKVLKRGIIIDGHENHKNRGHSTVTIAAKVTINGKDGIVGVVVKQTNGNNFKMLRIVAPDGSEFAFEYKNSEARPNRRRATTQGDALTSTRDYASDKNTISQSTPNVNTQIKKSLPEVAELDKKYLKAVEDGDMDTANRLLTAAAKKAGYTSESDYQGTSAFNGTAPSNELWYDTQEERMNAFINGEGEGNTTLGDYILNKEAEIGGLDMFLNHKGVYRAADNMRKEAIDNLRDAVNKKSDTITMYRSVPADIKEKSFRNGDWITPSKAYAVDNASVHGWKDYNIIEQNVSVNDIWWDGNDIAEWGYDDGNGEYVYQNTENNIKLNAVTYDVDGNVIPLSKRFDKNNADIRYSLAENNSAKYDYSTLTSKPDMFIADVGKVDIPMVNGKVDRKKVVQQSLENIKKVGNSMNTDDKVFLYNNDLDKNVKITANSIKHGLKRNVNNVIASLSIADYFKNAICVNELIPRGNTNGSYVLLGTFDSNKTNYCVRMIVIENANAYEVEDVNVLYAISTKTEPVAHYRRGLGVKTDSTFTGSTISIANFLEDVKKNFSDVLSDDVLRHFGISREVTPISGEVKWSLPEEVEEENKQYRKFTDNMKRQLELTKGEIYFFRIYQQKIKKQKKKKKKKKKLTVSRGLCPTVRCFNCYYI